MRRAEIWTAAAGSGYTLKPRPVVIIQDDRFDATGSVTVCAFTTDPTEAPLIRLPIVPDEQNGIREASSLMVDKITTVPRSKLGEHIGRLSDQDMEDLAAWYASQEISGGVADESKAALGEKIYRAGNAESGVPACMACHGPAGEGNPLSGYPALAGQHAVYTGSMLKRYRSGENWGPEDAPSKVMNGSASELTDEEIEALASYIEGLHLRAE